MHNGLAVGIDVGASFTKIGLVTSGGEIIDDSVIASELQSAGPEAFLAASGAVVERLVRRHEVNGIGISLCSIVNEARTGVLLSVNAPALAGLDVRQAFAGRFGLPVRVCNDVAAFALAEARFGDGRGVRRFLCLALGTGLAIAAVRDGTVLETWGGISADAGRIILDPNADVTCKAGVRGSAEALIGVEHIERLARAAAGRVDIRAREVIASARDGDQAAGEVMARVGAHVGHLLALLSPVYFPQRILITGGTAEAGEPLFAAARRRYAELIGDFMTTLSQLESGVAQPVEIRKAALGPEGAVIGAALSFFE